MNYTVPFISLIYGITGIAMFKIKDQDAVNEDEAS